MPAFWSEPVVAAFVSGPQRCNKMDDRGPQPRLSQPAVYRIVVEGRLDENWSTWFGGMTLTAERSKDGVAVTVLTGMVGDQPALHGLLVRVRDLGLPLLSVERLCP
jgi:hypothetical protein